MAGYCSYNAITHRVNKDISLVWTDFHELGQSMEELLNKINDPAEPAHDAQFTRNIQAIKALSDFMMGKINFFLDEVKAKHDYYDEAHIRNGEHTYVIIAGLKEFSESLTAFNNLVTEKIFFVNWSEFQIEMVTVEVARALMFAANAAIRCLFNIRFVTTHHKPLDNFLPTHQELRAFLQELGA